MKPYADYKNAGLVWLEAVPSHWDVLPNIALFDERIERGFVKDELLSVTIERGVIRQVELREKKDSSNEDKSAYKKVQVGDIAYNKMHMWQGAAGYSPFEGIVSPAYIVLKPKRRLNSRFYHYLFRTPVYAEESYRNSYGICDDQLSLRYSDFKRMQSIVPPPDEQGAIVAFLEAQEQEIQKFIANKRRTIELLKGQKAALINRAVTRGLDPNVPLKPSGISWLGEIPAYWTVAPVSARYQVQLGKMLDASRITGQYLASYLRNVDVQWDCISTDDLPQMDFSPADRIKFSLRRGDLLVCEGGEVGRAAIWNEELPDCFYQKALHRLRPYSTKDNPRFMLYLLFNASKQGVFTSHGGLTTIDHLPAETLRRYRFPFPPIDKQNRIVAMLDAEGQTIINAITVAEREIELMQEYRTALISAAVTGKIDCRIEAKT